MTQSTFTMPQKIPTLEEFWASFAQSQAKHEKWKAEADERAARIDAQIEKTSRDIARMSKNLGGLGNSIGELIETLVAAKLWEKFKDTSYSRLKRAYRRVQIFDNDNRERTDIDILLSDTDVAGAVEVKREVDIKDVDDHVRRMDLITQYPPAEAKGKRLFGAIAGGFVPEDVRDYAHKCGFYVLELQGESVTLKPVPEGFTPREWQQSVNV